MARYYDITFRRYTDAKTITVRGQGNTRTSAERSGRWKLRDKKLDPHQFEPIRFVFVPEASR
jgi:hypothetical protein